jgi:hypothetical protein
VYEGHGDELGRTAVVREVIQDLSIHLPPERIAEQKADPDLVDESDDLDIWWMVTEDMHVELRRHEDIAEAGALEALSPARAVLRRLRLPSRGRSACTWGPAPERGAPDRIGWVVPDLDGRHVRRRGGAVRGGLPDRTAVRLEALVPAGGGGRGEHVRARCRGSQWVDGLLRAEDAYRFAPSAVCTLLAMPIYVVDWAAPGPLGWSAPVYLVTVAGVQLTGRLLVRRHRLPPGFHGR